MGNRLCYVSDVPDLGVMCLSPDWDISGDLVVRSTELTRSDIAALEEFWPRFMQYDKLEEHSVCLIAFCRLFQVMPKLQDMFYVHTKLLTMEQWERYPLFMAFIRRVLSSFGITISLLNDQYACNEFLKTAACFHQSANMKKEHLATWMKIFDDELNNSLPDLYNGEVQSIFRKLLTIMLEKLTVGLN